ncbi:hypothetical protein LTR50_003470 [Elasticomyces elasticus]|nr:hypothetical protein LTR50_003470 [Elasticomyces elasticus]
MAEPSSSHKQTKSPFSNSRNLRDYHLGKGGGAVSRPLPLTSERGSITSRYSGPNDYDLEEIATPAAAQNLGDNFTYRPDVLGEKHGGSDQQQRAFKNRVAKDQPSRRNVGRQRSRASEVEEEEEMNLDEIAVPAPIQNRNDALSHVHSHSLEESRMPQWIASSEDLVEAPPFAYTKFQAEKGNPPASQKGASKFATQLFTVSYLILFSILGTLSRLGIQWLTFYPGTPLATPVLWANFAGSLIMGFLAEDRQLFQEEWGGVSKVEDRGERERPRDIHRDWSHGRKAHGTVKKTIPLYIGLATGFCGSLTSFSTFQRDVFLALSNRLPIPYSYPHTATSGAIATTPLPRNGGYSFLAVIAVLIYTTSLSLSALKIGAHVALALDPWTPTLSFNFTRRVLDRLVVFLAWGCWLGALFLCIWPPDRPGGPSSRGSSWANETWRGTALFAILFAPLGCLLRFYVSLKLNGIVASFPLGTFAVNMFGCAVEAMLYDLQHVPLSTASGISGGGVVGCQILQGLMDGFCGCLTTFGRWAGPVLYHLWECGMDCWVGLAGLYYRTGSLTDDTALWLCPRTGVR